MKKTPECPECERLVANESESSILTDFVDWLNSNGYVICTLEDTQGYPREQFISLRKTYEQLFADYFEIDLKKVEQERRALLASLRE